MEWFKGFVALLIALTFTACFIGVLHYTSFEQNHTHDWPSNQTQAQQTTDNQYDVKGIKPLSPNKSLKSTSAYPNDNSLQRYDHKAQIIMALIAFLGLMVAGVGLYFLRRTVVYTSEAASSTSKALEVARNATKAEFQPYISTLECIDFDVVSPDRGRKIIRLLPTLIVLRSTILGKLRLLLLIFLSKENSTVKGGILRIRPRYTVLKWGIWWQGKPGIAALGSSLIFLTGMPFVLSVLGRWIFILL